MNKIAIVFIQTNPSLSIENCIDSFIQHNPINNFDVYCIHLTPINKKIDKITYHFIKIESNKFLDELIPVSNYNYLLLLPNQYIIETELSITNFLSYLKNDIYQLQFLHTPTLSINLQYIINTPEFRYDSYKQIFNDPKPDITTDVVDYNSYADNKYSGIFKLVPSLLNVQHSQLQQGIPIFYNTIYERYYNNIFLKNLLSSFSVEIPIKINDTSSNTNIIDHEVTVVTGFIKVNNASKKHKYDYVECAKKTLSLPNPMVIYISEDLYEDVKKFRTELGFIHKTKLIVLTLSDLYMYDEKELLDQCCAKNKSPYHNSLYIMSVNSRYSYLEKAIANNYFNTDYYAWVDFGISHIVSMDIIRSITYNNPLKVRIAWIARKNLHYNHKCLGGGIFVAHKDIMKILCKLHNIEFRYNLSLGFCINDDKTLFFMFLNYPELFDIYFSGYNCLYEKIFTNS